MSEEQKIIQLTRLRLLRKWDTYWLILNLSMTAVFGPLPPVRD